MFKRNLITHTRCYTMFKRNLITHTRHKTMIKRNLITHTRCKTMFKRILITHTRYKTMFKRNSITYTKTCWKVTENSLDLQGPHLVQWIASLPPVLLCGFESPLGLESSGFSKWHFLKLAARGFLWVLQFPPLLHRFNGSDNKVKLK